MTSDLSRSKPNRVSLLDAPWSLMMRPAIPCTIRSTPLRLGPIASALGLMAALNAGAAGAFFVGDDRASYAGPEGERYTVIADRRVLPLNHVGPIDAAIAALPAGFSDGVALDSAFKLMLPDGWRAAISKQLGRGAQIKWTQGSGWLDAIEQAAVQMNASATVYWERRLVTLDAMPAESATYLATAAPVQPIPAPALPPPRPTPMERPSINYWNAPVTAPTTHERAPAPALPAPPREEAIAPRPNYAETPPPVTAEPAKPADFDGPPRAVPISALKPASLTAHVAPATAAPSLNAEFRFSSGSTEVHRGSTPPTVTTAPPHSVAAVDSHEPVEGHASRQVAVLAADGDGQEEPELVASAAGESPTLVTYPTDEVIAPAELPAATPPPDRGNSLATPNRAYADLSDFLRDEVRVDRQGLDLTSGLLSILPSGWRVDVRDDDPSLRNIRMDITHVGARGAVLNAIGVKENLVLIPYLEFQKLVVARPSRN